VKFGLRNIPALRFAIGRTTRGTGVASHPRAEIYFLNCNDDWSSRRPTFGSMFTLWYRYPPLGIKELAGIFWPGL
jgi:hypothetical protein